MKIFRIVLPLYNRLIKDSSRGKGYGKNKFVRQVLSFFDLLFRSNEVEVHGHKMLLPKKGFDEYSTQGIYGKFDTQAVESLIKPGDYVIDIGAAIGYFTLIFARAVGRKGFVFAFEPKKDRFDILSKNIQINNYSNVKIENTAIMKDEQKINLFQRDDGRSGLRYIKNAQRLQKHNDVDRHKIPIGITTTQLDSYLEKFSLVEKISFMKIDVDGPELLVLKGSKLLLKNNNLKIFMEWDKVSARRSGCEPSDIIDLLLQNNFKMFYPNYKENKFYKISKKELLEKPDLQKDTINMVFVKDPYVLEKNGLI